jgi:cation diffusion facilitator family transporter
MTKTLAEFRPHAEKTYGMKQISPALEPRERDRLVRKVLILEGVANLAVMVAKTIVGLSTGSLAVLGDALHSLTDMANNIVGLVVVHLASAPPDREHPYGHRKFETLAVFGLATLLTVLAFQIALRALEAGERTVVRNGWGLAVMVAVLGVNLGVSLWEGRWARRLDSDLLRADARHTLSDVLMTVVVIAGWQFAARGYAWLDTVFTIGISGFVLVLAYGLFKRVVPVLVDRIATEPEIVLDVVGAVPGVRKVQRIRSRWVGSTPTIDVVVSVDPDLPTVEAHAIADAIETALRKQCDVEDVTVHIEPDA